MPLIIKLHPSTSSLEGNHHFCGLDNFVVEIRTIVMIHTISANMSVLELRIMDHSLPRIIFCFWMSLKISSRSKEN